MLNLKKGIGSVVVNRDILKNHLTSFVDIIQGIVAVKTENKDLMELKKDVVNYIINKDVDIIFKSLGIDGGIIFRKSNENIREYRLRKLVESGKKPWHDRDEALEIPLEKDIFQAGELYSPEDDVNTIEIKPFKKFSKITPKERGYPVAAGFESERGGFQISENVKRKTPKTMTKLEVEKRKDQTVCHPRDTVSDKKAKDIIHSSHLNEKQIVIKSGNIIKITADDIKKQFKKREKKRNRRR